MNAFTIYPAIDLRDGKVVRLKEGDPARMTFYSDVPDRTARHWLEMGARWLHVVNLDGAFGEDDLKNQAALGSILSVASEFKANVQFGGGLRSLEAMERALQMGVNRLVLGTIAIEQPEMVSDAISQFDAASIAVGIDARDGFVRVRGWKDKSEIVGTDLALQMRTRGIRTIIYTDISRDGLGSGLNIQATRALAEKSRLDVVASGGVHTLEDVFSARDAGLAGVIVGRAIYDGSLNLKEALDGVSNAG